MRSVPSSIDVFDFFSGCGGTSCGFSQAGLNIKFGLDFDAEATQTFAANFPKAAVWNKDIRAVQPADIAAVIGERHRPLLFSGCAPCQPFSKQNRQKIARDNRRSLLAEFGRFVQYWRPEYVFVENVPGLQRVDHKTGPLAAFIRMLRRMGYSIDFGVVPASAYGVPQTRKRLVLLASLVGDIALPAPTHGEGLPVASVRDWIGDIAPIEAGQTHYMDPDHQCAELSPLNLERIRCTPEGGSRDAWPRKLLLRCHKGHSGHSDVYGRLAWDKPAAGLTTRCISYSNGRFGHPDQDRGLSVREAACIQTFPRTFVFKGSLSSKARQVGNAVPPLMAMRFGEIVKRHWRAETRKAGQDPPWVARNPQGTCRA